MPVKRNRSKRRRSASARLRFVAVIVVVLVVLAASVWYLLRGAGQHRQGPFEARLMELAAGRGVDDDHVTADDPIRKIDGLFVRTWSFDFPNAAARDGFLGDLEMEGTARKAQMTYQKAENEIAKKRRDYILEQNKLKMQVRRSEERVEKSNEWFRNRSEISDA